MKKQFVVRKEIKTCVGPIRGVVGRFKRAERARKLAALLKSYGHKVWISSEMPAKENQSHE